MSVLKLPKDVVADPRHDAVVQLLAENAGLLWENGRSYVSDQVSEATTYMPGEIIKEK